MATKRYWAIMLLIAGVAIGYFVYYSEITTGSFFTRPFKLGLDLRGGSQLVYRAKTEQIQPNDVKDAMESLREVIERRVNSSDVSGVFGVSENVVQTEMSGLGQGGVNRVIVELPGVTDPKVASEKISRTPILEFRTERPDGPEKEAIMAAREKFSAMATTTNLELTPELLLAMQDPDFISSELTGKYLKRATVEFNQQSLGPSIGVEFNADGAKIFAKITKENVGKSVGIFLDNVLISAPVVREEIRDGKAEISGQFTTQEAKQLARDLNLGALPVPVELESTRTIGASLGADAMNKGVRAGVVAFVIIALFMVLWYRLPGLIAMVSLSIYVAIMLAIFKLIPVTLTAAGIAGFILSIGIAVDANVLIFERLKEELRRGKDARAAVAEGFTRAWTSIRDSNLATIISAMILFWFGTSLIKGFALNLALGVFISMFSAIAITKTFLIALGIAGDSALVRFLFSSGFSVVKKSE